jgi:hypothetical protein
MESAACSEERSSGRAAWLEERSRGSAARGASSAAVGGILCGGGRRSLWRLAVVGAVKGGEELKSERREKKK